MPHKRLFLLVEGDDDERFVERIAIPGLSSRYDCIEIWKYARQKNEKVDSFLRSVKAMGADYFLLADINSHPCPTKKKESLSQRFRGLDTHHVLVVVSEIESWYLAGLADNNPLGVSVPKDTSRVTKEGFQSTLPDNFDSRIDYMVEVLRHFDINTATRRNSSFEYFARRCGLRSP